jgi:phosphate transport system ATP-binding protein
MAKNVQMKDVDIYYGKFHAVHAVNLSVPPRAVTAFIGPSGCGKSTVLRTINRMHEIIPGARVEGRVELDGEDIYRPGVDPVEVRRSVGMVFQRPNPFPAMSIRDNVVAGLKLRGTRNKSQLEEVTERSLRGANLWKEVKDRLGKPGGSLSGGQQQRLCIARAIAVQPDVLLMDEPCSALDPISTLAIEELIGQLKKDYTIVIVTHNMQQAARVSDQTGFFNLPAADQPGRLVELDDTEKIFSQPDKKGYRGTTFRDGLADVINRELGDDEHAGGKPLLADRSSDSRPIEDLENRGRRASAGRAPAPCPGHARAPAEQGVRASAPADGQRRSRGFSARVAGQRMGTGSGGRPELSGGAHSPAAYEDRKRRRPAYPHPDRPRGRLHLRPTARELTGRWLLPEVGL